MKIINNNIYRIKSLGNTYSTYFFNPSDRYYKLLPKMNCQYILKKTNSCSFTGKICYIDFIKIDEVMHKTDGLMFLLYNKIYDIYVLMLEKDLIKI